MQMPSLALVGRPNVGKSTLFNRLTHSETALTADFPGLTRDRKYGTANIRDRQLAVVDTGGFDDRRGDSIAMGVKEQIDLAIAEADLLLFVVDARNGLHPAEYDIARQLRITGKSWLLVVNKCERGIEPAVALAEFSPLAAEYSVAVSAAHGEGFDTLRQQILAVLSGTPPDDAEDKDSIAEDAPRCIAIIGRPNSGKSTLVNRLLGVDRMLVDSTPGTTRDSIELLWQCRDVLYRLIDTAGIRRRSRIHEHTEKISVASSLRSIRQAQLVLLLVDAGEGLADQDLHLLRVALRAGRGVIVALNKIDQVIASDRLKVRRELRRRLQFAPYIENTMISGRYGVGFTRLYRALQKVWDSITMPLPTHRINEILRSAVAARPPPYISGQRIKLRYAHVGGRLPHTLVIHGSQASRVPADYKRYLGNCFRTELGLTGLDLQLVFRSPKNIFTDPSANG